MFTQKFIKIFHSVQGIFHFFRIWHSAKPRPMINVILQFLGLDLFNIKLSAKFYQNIPNGLIVNFTFLAHLSRRLTRWAYRIGLEPASVCPCVCVCPLTISNMNISKTRGPIATKFYLKHYWGGEKPALGFGPGRIRTLISMAADSSHRVIMGKTASPRFLGCFWSDPFHTCR